MCMPHLVPVFGGDRVEIGGASELEVGEVPVHGPPPRRVEHGAAPLELPLQGLV